MTLQLQTFGTKNRLHQAAKVIQARKEMSRNLFTQKSHVTMLLLRTVKNDAADFPLAARLSIRITFPLGVY